MTCPQCGSEYEITSAKVICRDSDSLDCDVCGYTLKKWSGSHIYEKTLVRRREWPKKESTQL
jgi:transposase-like protein